MHEGIAHAHRPSKHERSEHIIRPRVGDGVRRREQEMDTKRQLVRPVQGPALPPSGEQYVPRRRQEAAGPRDRHQLRDPQGAQVQSGDGHVPSVAGQ